MDTTAGFTSRHIGPNEAEVAIMLKALDLPSLDKLVDATVPRQIRIKRTLQLPAAKSEHDALRDLRAMFSKNRICRSYIGMGYSGTITPPVIQRGILENPGWYTQYTPYQAEISQGRLEAMMNFQTMVMDLTGLAVANASLLDEGTAAAEAMAMCSAIKGKDGERRAFFLADHCHPQTIEVVKTRAHWMGIPVVVGKFESVDWSQNYCGALVQYPATDGTVHNFKGFIEKAHASGALVAMACDILALTVMQSPG